MDAVSGSMLPHVRIASFQGPLDLLLHLVRTDALDVTILPIAEVARQYDAYVESLGDADPETTGDALLTLATLIYMKSRRLLPVEPGGDAALAGAEEPARETPSGAGVHDVVEHLREREAIMELVFARPAAGVAEFASEQGIEADLYALLRAFRGILERAGGDPVGRVGRERITLAERIHWLMDRLERDRRVAFRSLFEDLTDRVSYILTFLALLEVIRLRLVRAYTGHRQDEIVIVLAAEESPPRAASEQEIADV